ncbi:EscU/YscU/HrcU family type III secretion system export apparatus switch protein [Clostridium aestuarii]|uniref:EscU/YscU/HrcU family type III secretion system export apparatus switch protein n=1 Tax=Clostridium aestuarii TaxID=338193 RepID=A0ABT4CXW3_9CLOT|nr:EscU/YscU/HrcU family type III secretion system export apparatus switch protein [Clostridium aestuarii]MCY6483202.1 EscU/YscU/HrcU family type III secretion system export apparatus switch protein [Clostridium aestuarii]
MSNNKERRKAAALKYELNYDAPKVTAAGVGYIADKILEEAEKNDVPIVYNKELADLLTNVDVGSYVPEELYEAVAEVIAYIMDIDSLANGR